MAKLKAVAPVVKAASTEVAYPDFWLAGMQIMAQNPNGQVSINGRLLPSRDLEDGTKEVLREGAIRLNIPDVFAVITENPTGKVAVAYNAILEALIEYMPEVTSE